GYHYMQGAYYWKSFRKHGELSNPYAYGFFPGIEEKGSRRVTTSLMIYEAPDLPERYHEAFMAANPVVGLVPASRRVVKGPSFHSASIDLLARSDSRWFRPVYVDFGPDGALYVADWRDLQVNHYRNHEGKISRRDGRIHRLRKTGAEPIQPLTLHRVDSSRLVELLRHNNRWYRETARRLLHQREDRSVIPTLKTLFEEPGQIALEALWALNLLDAFDESMGLVALDHPHPMVRFWSIRLIGDDRRISDTALNALLDRIETESDLEVRSQLAATARRLPASSGLPLVQRLVKRDTDSMDAFMPHMIWWALESKCGDEPEASVEIFADAHVMGQPMAQRHLLAFLMKRLASEGKRRHFRSCARLFDLATNEATTRTLLAAFEEAMRGRSMSGLPESLNRALEQAGGGSLALRLRRNRPAALDEVRVVLTQRKKKAEERIQLIEILAESPRPELLPVLMEQLSHVDVRLAALNALEVYNRDEIGRQVLERYAGFQPEEKSAVQALVSSRVQWSRHWLEAIEAGRIQKDETEEGTVAKFRSHEDEELNKALDRLWPPGPADDGEQRIREIGQLITAHRDGDPYAGRKQYQQRCASCHELFNEGGQIGPELTTWQRKDLDGLLLAIIKPNAEIREGFETVTVKTKDGRVVAGFLTDADDQVLIVRPVGGRDVVLARADVKSMEPAGVSLMPPGLLSGMSDRDLVDFFSYLRSSQPLNMK
ncbi:MAG: hypothetical protein AAF492_06325, partial [Verrucomicrobiota bacterium]